MKNISAKKNRGRTKLNLEDDQLLEIVIKLRDLMPEWKWSLGMIYCYGLRPSEVFGAIVNQEDKTCVVLGINGDEDELEERIAFPLDKSLVDLFDLNNVDRPWEYNISDKKYDAIYSKIKTDQMGKRLKRIIKKENFPQFTLNMIRHSWAKRAIKSKFSTSDCAISMGYSIKEFQDKYLISVKKLDNAAIQETN
ncbi:hypothetical protein OA320_04040 [Prochlorococcus sp. AH-716-O10]|nr:hypothetical protein [Prochlorococcus sp. AH-716-O10]